MRKQTLTLFLLILLTIGCGQAATESYAPAYDTAAEEMAFASDEGGTLGLTHSWTGSSTDNVVQQSAPAELDIARSGERQQVQQRLIIKTGNMSIEVDDLDMAVDDAISLATGLGGYIVSQEVSGYDRYRTANLTLGVPVAEFENVMAVLREYGRVEVESATGEDVTEEYVDLNSQLTNLTAVQERLRALLEEARTVEDTLEVDRELRQVEGEINVIQGRIKYLADRAAFSTIMVRFSFQAEASVPEPENFNLGRTAQTALVQLQDTAYEVSEGAVYFGIVCGPWLLLLLLIGWMVRGVVRRVRRRGETISAETPPAPDKPEPTDD